MSTQRRIRVMLVEDSPVELRLLQKMIGSAEDMEVVGSATNGVEALHLLTKLKPDLVCTDYYMPVMDGLGFIRQAMQVYPCPIVVLSIGVQANEKDNIFRLLSAGAVDVMPKPITQKGRITTEDLEPLLEKIRGIASSPMMRGRLARPAPSDATRQRASGEPRPVQLIAIGASTGGPQCLERILGQLPADFGIPVVCVQHISNGFLGGMISWLQSSCRLRIELAIPGEQPTAGHVYFAPDGQHLTFDNRHRFRFHDGQAKDVHCPGVDMLLRSVAQQYGPDALGILLSGMGRDGALGLKAMRQAGATTVAQDEATSVVFGMPAAAIELGAAQYVLPPDEIVGLMSRLDRSANLSRDPATKSPAG